MTYRRRTWGRHTHGFLKNGRRPPEYPIWAMMMQKCYNPDCREFGSHGAKGVRVCERWRHEQGFANFLADVGPQPHPGDGLKRLNDQGDFEPGNVAWADTRPRRLLTHDGRSMTLAEWAAELGARVGTLRQRLHKGWPVAKVLTRRVADRCPSCTWRRRERGKATDGEADDLPSHQRSIT